MPIIVRAVLLLLACWPLSATAQTDLTRHTIHRCIPLNAPPDADLSDHRNIYARVYNHWAYVDGAARKYDVGHLTCVNGQMFNHAGAECAKRGIAVESPDEDRVRQCIEFGVVDFDCRQTRNPNPNDTPEACVQRRLAGGPKWLVPGAEAPAMPKPAPRPEPPAPAPSAPAGGEPAIDTDEAAAKQDPPEAEAGDEAATDSDSTGEEPVEDAAAEAEEESGVDGSGDLGGDDESAAADDSGEADVEETADESADDAVGGDDAESSDEVADDEDSATASEEGEGDESGEG